MALTALFAAIAAWSDDIQLFFAVMTFTTQGVFQFCFVTENFAAVKQIKN
jgi:hypothetical protein